MEKQLRAICDQYGIELKTDEPLSRHTTFRMGGKADFWAEISSIPALQALLQFCRERDYPYFVMGRGSNVLASDEGYRGMILHIGKKFSHVSLDKEGGTLCSLAGTSLAKTAQEAARAGLSGMEGLCGIPGTIGGALYMNAGAYGYEMKDITLSCTYLDEGGNVRTAQGDAMQLSYRHSLFSEQGGIILSVTMGLAPGDPGEISAKMEELDIRRREKQPLEFPSAGSTFKRPSGSFASLLIDQCGLKGMQCGGARISEKHAGFVINTGGATCTDVLTLCRRVRETVEKETGYVLELEPVLLK